MHTLHPLNFVRKHLGALVPQLNTQRGGGAPQAAQQIEMTDGPTVINGVDLSRLQFGYVGPPGNRVSVDAINQIERIRKQLEDLKGSDEQLAAARALDKKLKAVEDLLLQPVAHENDPKAYREPMTIYFHYLHLLGQVGNGAGDMAGNPGFKPTDQSREFHAILKKRLDDALAKLKAVLDTDVARFNQTSGVQLNVAAKP